MKKGDYYYEKAVRKLFESMGFDKAEIDLMCPPLPPEPTNIASEELEDKPEIITKEQAIKRLERLKKMMAELGTSPEKIKEFELEEIRKIDQYNSKAVQKYNVRKAKRLERLRKHNRRNGPITVDLAARRLPGKSFEEMKKELEARIKAVNKTIQETREEMTR